MNIVLVAKPGIDLYATLAASETARNAIRFYQPVDLLYGVFIRVPTVAGALALTSDIRYYTRRYVYEILYGFYPPLYCTASLAEGTYILRNVNLKPPWPYRLLYRLSPENSMEKWRIFDTSHIVSPCSFIDGSFQAEVWCSQEEFDLVDTSI